MQRREHDGPVSAALIAIDRFEIADLADHDDVRVLAQERFQRRREVIPTFVPPSST